MPGRQTVTGGTHTVFLAHVAVAAGHERAPLYFRGRFGRLESVREDEAYQAVRNWVLTRRVPLDRPLDPAALAESLELDPGHAAYALVRLAGEQVVTRDSGRPLRPHATDRRARRRAVRRPLRHRARCGRHVRRAHPGTGPRGAGGIRQRLAAIVAQEKPSLDEFLDASHNFHRHYVGLGGSPQLRDTYGALGISTLWRRDARRAGLAHPVRRHLSRRSHRGLP